MATFSLCRGFARDFTRVPVSGTILPQIVRRQVVCPGTIHRARISPSVRATQSLQWRAFATAQQDSSASTSLVGAQAVAHASPPLSVRSEYAQPDGQQSGRTAALASPALALSAIPLVPAEHTETVWWAFESCVGVGDIKMGLGGLAAQVFFLVPSTVMMRIMKENSIGGLPLIPYSAMFANGTIWVTYGALLGNPAIWLPNMPAVFFGALYSAIFLKNTPAGADWLPRTPRHHALGVAGIVSVVLGSTFCLESSVAAQVVGILGNVVCVTMFAGPLSAIRTVLREKSTRSLPLGMCIMTVVNCSLWTFYGAAMLEDPLIWFPNSLGLLSGLVQLGLFMRFGIHR